MQNHNTLIEPKKAMGAWTFNTVSIPPYLLYPIQRVSELMQRVDYLHGRFQANVRHTIDELLALASIFDQYQYKAQRWNELDTDLEQADRKDICGGKDTTLPCGTAMRDVDLRPSDNGSHSPRAPTSEDTKVSPRPVFGHPHVSVPTSTELYRGRQGSGSNRAHHPFENRPAQTSSTTKSNSAVNDMPMHNACKFICATQFSPENNTAPIQAKASQIALNCNADTIYRFAPSSNRRITVSIDWESFGGCGIHSELVKQLHQGLEFTITNLNNLQLGIMFEFKHCAGRGLIELKYGGPGAFRHGGDIYKLWAETQFPTYTVREYTILIYASTFEQNFRSSIPNILSHEFGHLLAMRHWNAEANEPSEPSVQYPAGDYDEQSIMGRFDHPGQLYYHQKDIEWLRKFCSLKDGQKINGKTIKDIQY